MYRKALSVDGLEFWEVVVGVEPCPEFFKSFVVVDSRSGDAIVVDPGPSKGFDKLVEALNGVGVRDRVKGVLATHIHVDHYGAGPRLCRELGVALYVHPRAVKHVVDPTKLWQASLQVLGRDAEVLGAPQPLEPSLVHSVGDGEVLRLGSIEVRALHTPGHAPHHVVFVVGRVAFVGDALGGYDPVTNCVFPTSPPGLKLDVYVDSMLKVFRGLGSYVDATAFTHLALTTGFTNYVSRHARQILSWIEVVEQLGRKPSIKELAQRDPEVSRFLSKPWCPRIAKSFERSLEAVHGEWLRLRSSSGGEEVIRKLRSMIVVR